MTLTKKDIRKKVTTDPKWAMRAISVLYEYQTADEQSDGTTRHSNKVGFNGVDAQFLSSLAYQINLGRNLTKRQLEVAMPRLGKYAGQLLVIAENKTERSPENGKS